MQCPICLHEARLLRHVETVAYFRCLECELFFAHPDFLTAVDAGAVENYRDAYWGHEIPAARERSFGAGVVRMAETLRMARIPVRRGLDIGSGPGFLLDALAELVPSLAEEFMGSNASRLLHRNAVAARTIMSAPLPISMGRSTPGSASRS